MSFELLKKRDYMNSWTSNFVKRALVIPGIITVVIIAIILLIVPKMISDSNHKEADSVEVIDLSQFNVKEYETISELKRDGYVGSFSCSDVSLEDVPVVYNALESSNVSAIKGSVEPWAKKGGIVVKGITTHQMPKLDNAKIGDTIQFNYYGNNSYSYKIRRIIPAADSSELSKYLEDKTLAVAVPFNDFSNLGEKYFYTVYVAELQEL